jgi:hypothetical protein
MNVTIQTNDLGHIEDALASRLQEVSEIIHTHPPLTQEQRDNNYENFINDTLRHQRHIHPWAIWRRKTLSQIEAAAKTHAYTYQKTALFWSKEIALLSLQNYLQETLICITKLPPAAQLTLSPQEYTLLHTPVSVETLYNAEQLLKSIHTRHGERYVSRPTNY